MRYLLLALVGFGTFAFADAMHAATQSWPASSGTSIGGALAATAMPSGSAFEPSDMTIVDGNVLLVSDEGDVATMNPEGGNLATWLTWSGNDQEGVTVVGNVLYILNERYRDVSAYDLATHALLRTYDLSPWIAGEDNLGPEALVYHNGQWLVGHSETEEIFAFDLSGASAVFLGSWNSGAHVRAMHSGEDGKLYVMSGGRVVVFDGTTALVDYALPSGPIGPEGFALRMDCAAGTATAFIAYDSGSVYRYEGFPVSCPATETVDDVPLSFSAVGTTNGSIIVTYGDGSSQTYRIFDVTTTRLTDPDQYKDSSYLVVVAPHGKRVAVVDPYTGQVVAMRSFPREQAVLDAWLASVIGY